MPNSIDKHSECPHCGGSTGYLIRFKISGFVEDQFEFNGEQSGLCVGENTRYQRVGKYYKCLDCQKNIAKYSTDGK